MITQEELKEILDYDPGTGVFTRLKARNSRLVGKEAGYVHGAGYRYIHLKGKMWLAHRLAFLWMTGYFPEDEVDHLNTDRSDNRWENLRGSNRSQNQRHKLVPVTNTSGFKGVSKSHHNKWACRITVSGENRHIGYFETKREAARAYDEAAKKYHGEFALTNESLGLL